MCDPKTHITIDKLKGRAIGRDLFGCYFRYVTETEDRMSFFAPDGEEKAQNLHLGSEFTFLHKKKNWTLTITSTSCEKVSGKWKASNTSDPDQSYQAQAGGTVPDEENAAAANV